MTFQTGKSGNPAGKRRGTRHRTTMAAQALLDGEAEGLTRKCIEMALSGDATALRLALDRVLPLRRGRPVQFDLPPMHTPADLVTALGSVALAASRGDLTPDEAGSIGQLLNAQSAAIELVEFRQRLIELERKMNATRERQ